MSLDSLIMLSGVCVALVPFLGISNSWDRVIFVALGILVISLGIVVRRRSGVRAPQSSVARSSTGTPNHEIV